MDTEGLFARFFEDARIPYVSWFTDTPRMILYGRKMHLSPWSIAATWERAYLPHFEALGYEHIYHMPLATDPALFNAEPAPSHARPLAFVGNSMIEHTAEAIDRFRDKPAVLRAVIEAFDTGRVTRDTYALGLPAMLPPEVLAPLDRTDLRNLELLINYEATQRQRVDLARSLAPLGLEVRGDPHWLQVHDKVGGSVGYFDDLAPFYRGTAVNVNSTSLQMRAAVNQRVFDCPAAGGFLITDAQGDLFEHFDPDGGEVVAYRALEELRDLADHYLRHPAEAREITLRARRRILAKHTLEHRLRDLTAYLRGRFA
jgi:spore maturation protein CgeB